MEPNEIIQNQMRAFMRSSVLIALAELDIATILLRNNNKLSVSQVAQAADCDYRGCQTLLDALASLGYFKKTGHGDSAIYSVVPEYSDCLDSRHPASLVPIMRHMGCIQRKWAQLAKSVKNGEPGYAAASILGEEEDRVSFIMGMNSVAMSRRDGVMESLVANSAMPADTAKILDVGGASGTYAEAFLNRLPAASVTIFDLPVGIKQAKKRFGDNSRVSLLSGDFTQDKLPAGHDYAWVSAIIHQLSREESRELYGKIHAALNADGIIAIRDYVMDAQGLQPVEGALFGLNMLINTALGRVYTYKEIEEDLLAAGFDEVRLAVEDEGMSSIVTAKKLEQH